MENFAYKPGKAKAGWRFPKEVDEVVYWRATDRNMDFQVWRDLDL